MIDLSDKKVLVYDYGSYVEIAQRLSRDFGTVFYYNPAVYNGYKEHTPLSIGKNIEGVIKVEEWASVIDEVDLVVHPDSHEPHLQDYFRRIGKAVFGSAFACSLEHDRKLMKSVLKEGGLPVNTYYIANGLDELDEFLKGGDDKYVKSSLRGDMESWHHVNYLLSQREIKRMRHDMGIYENKEIYIVEDPIEGVAEIGYDGFCIDGQYPSMSMCGIEIKDCGYLGKFVPYTFLPEQLRLVNECMSKPFSELGYRGAYSNEVIISKDKRGFLIDNTNRCPQPNTSLALEAYENYSEIVWEVANGRIPMIKFNEQWGCQLIIKSDSATTQPSPIIVPEEFKNNVKMKNLTIDEEGRWWYSPLSFEMIEIGSVVATGKTMEEAIKKAKEISESIKGFDTYIKVDSLDKAKKSIDKLNKAGISFI